MDIGLITYSDAMAQIQKQQLKSVFGNLLTINTYSLESDSPLSFSAKDAFRVVSRPSVYFETLKDFEDSDTKSIHATLTFSKEGLNKLLCLPRGTRAILVSLNEKIAGETITAIYQSKITHLDLIPYKVGSPIPDGIDVAITPGETQLVPQQIKKTIDISHRMFDIQTIVDIAIEANCEHVLESEAFQKYCDIAGGIKEGGAERIVKYGRLQHEFDTLMHMLDVGVLGIDDSDVIYVCNDKATELLGYTAGRLSAQSAHTIIPSYLFERCRNERTPIKARIPVKNNRQLRLTLTPLLKDNFYSGCFAMLFSSEENEIIHQQIVNKFMQKGHRARYQFSDIVGKSLAMQKTISLAKVMAKSDSSILITGESGTGKELLAQSIHRYSDRAHAPFVAINCGAIPDTLMESELFGYEDGSFTGAKKGGKIGLLEIANSGTVFLDEIEDMNPLMQVKLLRFIQEHEIMRLGGDTLIPLDVRIISATNKNLLQKVREGKFREDLYYRISTLPIEVPPLRERADDMLIIFEHIKATISGQYTLSPDAKERIRAYQWPGNIRELQNCVEFLKCLNVPTIHVEHLPGYLRESEETILSPLFENELMRQIAEILRNGPCGRRQIVHQLTGFEYPVTEAQVRGVMEHMSKQGWIQALGGRSGSILTERGKKALL